MTARPGPITIVHLYPRDMNIYGDHGNVLTLLRRLHWHGYRAEVVDYNQGDRFPAAPDILVGGGGQDSGQTRVEADLHKQAQRLTEYAEDGMPMLMVCGLYQLFGRFFRTADGTEIKGIGLLDLETRAGKRRLVGNVVSSSSEFGDVIGFENHSGETFLGSGTRPLGRVPAGVGNNGVDGTEGAQYRNVIATYLHGSVLPKNPRLADHLLATAVRRKFGHFEPRPIDDTMAEQARAVASRRPR
jgi:CobQ-like glutamine amidotransferase family enzyme